MKLNMHSNAEEGLLLIEFDAEGRAKLLGDIERTIAQQTHESRVPDDAPLHVDDGMYISGGKTALMDLYNRICLLPADCKELKLAVGHDTPRRKRFRISWLLGGISASFF